MTAPVIMDAVAVGAAVLLAAFGAWRGVFKTLLGVVVFVLALAGAAFIASRFTDPITEKIVPYVMEQVDAKIQQTVNAQTQNAADYMEGAVSGAGTSLNIPDLSTVPGFDSASDTVSMGQLPALLEKFGLSQESRTALVDRIREKLESLGQSTANSARVALEDILRETLKPIIHAVLYGVSFLLLSLVLKIAANTLGGALNKIPGLSAANHTLGFLLGLAEGLLLLVIVSWILRVVGVTVEAPPLSDTVVLRFLAEHSLLDLIPGTGGL